MSAEVRLTVGMVWVSQRSFRLRVMLISCLYPLDAGSFSFTSVSVILSGQAS